MARPRKQPAARQQPQPAAASARHAARWPALVSCAAVVACAFVFGFHKIDDFDTWWHLAAGRWIVDHGSIPVVDTLSHTVRDHAWLNLQWGFDVALYAAHSAGGPALLTTINALAFAAAILILLVTMARRAGGVTAAAIAVLVVLTAQERVTLRPELLSFVWLSAVLFVLDRSRHVDDRWAFALVPLMILWANTHALFIVGVFAIVCALIGRLAAPSRRFAIAAVAACLATAINPFGLRGVAFPFKLISRIDGSNDVFQTIGEFGSPFAVDAAGVSIAAYKFLLAIGILAAVASIFAGLRKKGSSPAERFDWGELVFFAGLALVSATARRNTALFAVGMAPFLGGAFARIAAAHPRLRQAALARNAAGATAASAAAIVLGGSVVTGAFYRYEQSPQEFGTGVIEGTFAVRASAFARAADLPPNLYNDMAAGGYLSWDNPLGTGVFVDGRLEVYDAEFLADYVTARSNAARWDAAADRYGVQTAIIFHRFEPDRLLAGRLIQDERWALVYDDEVAAVFVRKAGNDAAIARAVALRPEWDARTLEWLNRPADPAPYPAGRIEGTRAYARFLATAGRAEPAVAAYERLLELGIPPKEEVERRLLLARYFASKGLDDKSQAQIRRVLELEPANADAIALRK